MTDAHFPDTTSAQRRYPMVSRELVVHVPHRLQSQPMLSEATPRANFFVQAADWTGAPRASFDPARLIARATNAAGRKRFSDDTFLGGLNVLIESCRTEANLSAFGEYALRLDVMRSLTNLLNFEVEEERNPSVLERAIVRPLFITGMPRSGTTFLHTLLAQDPANAVPRAWQTMYPYRDRRKFPGRDLRRLRAEMQLWMFRLLSPEICDLHPMSADAPQECTDITAQIFQSLRFDSTYRVPSYQAWIRAHGHKDAYRFHRRFLAHLDAQRPGRRWILKSPDHVFALDAIRHVYPDASFVFLHRSPLDVLASVLKLTEVLRRPFTRRLDRYEIGEQVSAYWEEGAHRMSVASHNATLNGLHIRYDELVSSPLKIVADIYRYCGYELTDHALNPMRAWLSASQGCSRRQRAYSLAEFGLDPGILRKRFSQYMSNFGVTPDETEHLMESAKRRAA